MMISTSSVFWMLFLSSCAAESLVKLTVDRGSSSTVYHADSEPGKYALSKSWDENPATFFHGISTDGWAKYNIPVSNVKRVRVQNRKTCCEHRMTNNVVYVCADESDSSCQECGRVTGKIGRSAWAEMDCSLRGTIVKVAATDSMLQIAQIEIFSDGVLTVNSGSSSPVYHADSEPGKYALSKSWDEIPVTFFHGISTDGWAKYNIPESNVKRVRVQNRKTCCEHRMTNNVVYVCADESDASCQECGRVTGKIGRSAWAEIDCSLRGTIVKVAATTSMLQIAQIEIIADAVYASK